LKLIIEIGNTLVPNLNPEEFLPVVNQSVSNFNKELNKLFDNLTPLMSDQSIYQEYSTFPAFVSSTFTIAIAHINEQAMYTLVEKTQNRAYPVTLARIWLLFERDVHISYEKWQKRVGSLLGKEIKGSSIEKPIKSTKARIRDTAQQFLWFFVCAEGEKLGEFVNIYFKASNWLKVRPKEPSNVESIIFDILTELSELRTYLLQTFQAFPPISAGGSPPTMELPHSPREDPLNSSQNFRKIDFDPASVLSAIMKVCMHTFLECVRLVTFSNHGYQQIQINSYYLKEAIYHNNMRDPYE